jgi:rhodanese-related sulfurtransferase
MTPEITDILAAGAERGKKLGLPYAGAVTPQEAHRLQTGGAARIIDVRTEPERQYVGKIPAADPVEWRTYGAQQSNPHFLTELQRTAAPDEVVLFLCRSAQRSHSAATVAASAGYRQAYNILEGFEGTMDAEQHRGNVDGWRKAGLPWVQS